MLKEYFHIQIQPSIGFLLPLDYTAGVITLTHEQICPVPGVLPTLLGVINQQGRLLWVVDLSNLLGINQSKNLQLPYNLTLLAISANSTNSPTEQAERQFGCVVSALMGIVSLDVRQFNPVPAEFSPVLGSFLSGVAEIEHSSVFVLNVDAVFTALSNLDTSLVPS